DAAGSAREIVRLGAEDVSLDEKVAFLSRTTSYRQPVRRVGRRETHMSWIFLAGEEVYKLKKPLRFPYLDFSTLARREAACRAELTLNRRLAPNVYKAVVPIRWWSRGLTISGPGGIADWLGGAGWWWWGAGKGGRGLIMRWGGAGLWPGSSIAWYRRLRNSTGMPMRFSFRRKTTCVIGIEALPTTKVFSLTRVLGCRPDWSGR